MTSKNSNAARSLALMAVFGAAVFIKTVYRPWIQEHGINDLGFGGWSPSFLLSFGVTLGVCCAFGLLEKTKRHKWVALLAAIIAGLMYEGMQMFTARLVFDVWDIVATVVGCAVGFVFDKHIQIEPEREIA